jgi:hypothetical protein
VIVLRHLDTAATQVLQKIIDKFVINRGTNCVIDKVQTTAASDDFVKLHVLLHLNDPETIYYNQAHPPAIESLNVLRKGLKLSLIPRVFDKTIAYVVSPARAVVRLGSGKFLMGSKLSTLLI